MNPADLFVLANSGAATYFYVVGGALVVLALAIAFAGMRSDDFPSTNLMRGLIGLFAAVVVATGVGAVLAARDEQAIRHAENEEAAHETEKATEAAEEAEAPETEAEAAEPAGEPDASAPADDGVDGGAIFVDTGCGACHTLAAAGTDGAIGPNLDDVLPGQDAEAVRTSIVDPGAEVSEGFPAGTMPANYGEQLNEVQLDVLVAYLLDNAG